MSEILNPRITIGMPVFNGQNYVAEAINSICHQTFRDFQLVVSDNASTDATESICRRAAARDPRIRYHRNPQNIGAGRNFNRCFELASGELFKWAAHDDVLAPTFLERCVAELDAAPDAVLVYPLVQVIDEQGRVTATYDSGLGAAASTDVAERFRTLLLTRHMATEIFGLIRREALARTRLHEDYNGSDKALLAELGLQGRFITIGEPLFMNRDHPDRYVRAVYPDPKACLSWYAPHRAGKPAFPKWSQLRAYSRMVGRHVAGLRARSACYLQVMRWVLSGWTAARLVLEPLTALDPRLFSLARSIKRRLFGHASLPMTAAKEGRE